LAADHRARGIVTVEPYAKYLEALEAALPYCDGILASAQPLGDLALRGAVEARHRTYLSINRTGLSGSAGELDDRLVASVERAAAEGWSGVKHMTRLDQSDPVTSAALELLGRVLEDAARAGLEALVECVPWRDGGIDHDLEAIIRACVIAHDIGAPLLKAPVPAAPAGERRIEAVARVVGSVGVPVLFLGGPRSEPRESTLQLVGDVMAGGAGGLALGRAIYEDGDPAESARLVAALVHNQ
jgi:DhnA family fructose-bisphosphate aldolase class Ia